MYIYRTNLFNLYRTTVWYFIKEMFEEQVGAWSWCILYVKIAAIYTGSYCGVVACKASWFIQLSHGFVTGGVEVCTQLSWFMVLTADPAIQWYVIPIGCYGYLICHLLILEWVTGSGNCMYVCIMYWCEMCEDLAETHMLYMSVLLMVLHFH